MQILLLINKIVKRAEKQNIKYRITTATSRVPERMQRHQLFKRTVKEIDNSENSSPYKFMDLSHCCKGIDFIFLGRYL